MAAAKRRLSFGLWYDFRNPLRWRQPFDRLYNETIDQIAWAENNGFDYVWLSEHHFIDDGYSPALMPTAAAIAARTKRIRISTAVLLMPFHNPIRMAEDAATVDVISGGRFELGVGTGYKLEEFDAFQIPFKERGRRTDESLEIIRRLWEGETLSFEGRHFKFKNVKLTPEPIQKPRPRLWVGGFTPAAARRAARYADGFVGWPEKAVWDIYTSELAKLGKSADNLRLARMAFPVIPSRDPEKTWNEAADHIIYQHNLYSRWYREAGDDRMGPEVRDRAHLRELGTFKVYDVDGCIKAIREATADLPYTDFFSFFLPPGLPPRWLQPHLELFASKVIPAFR
ncbi:MAG TPA: LLM class flavin-dependent oxidoreductase [Candidatus Binataceae bacterium]|nr:LLM class flavin-dependent oxidoreductase [Candidatus Binataceae bacterium]